MVSENPAIVMRVLLQLMAETTPTQQALKKAGIPTLLLNLFQIREFCLDCCSLNVRFCQSGEDDSDFLGYEVTLALLEARNSLLVVVNTIGDNIPLITTADRFYDFQSFASDGNLLEPAHQDF